MAYSGFGRCRRGSNPKNFAADREIVGQRGDEGVAQIEVAADREIIWQRGDGGAVQSEAAADREIVGQRGNEGAAQIEVAADREIVGPVSYTHLDVYKRQEFISLGRGLLG